MTTTTVQQVCEYEGSECAGEKESLSSSKIGTDYNFKRKIVWKNVVGFFILHLGALYGLYLAYTEIKWYTTLWTWFLVYATGVGVTGGAHRLYAHKTFKAKLPFKLALIILQTMAGQNCMYIWVRDHRQHHKYSDTDADPHNSNRGFFFCHMGWLMSKKHPLVIEKGKTIDLSDLEADPLIMFQAKYYFPLYIVFAILIPTYIPALGWGESAWNSLFVCYFFRYLVLLHGTWTINSFAHLYGSKPFDKNIVPVECKMIQTFTIGEGWHNYHHTFPWDYKASEIGAPFNVTRIVIDIMAYLGMAYDLKQVPLDMIRKRIKRTGDGTHDFCSSSLATTDKSYLKSTH